MPGDDNFDVSATGYSSQIGMSNQKHDLKTVRLFTRNSFLFLSKL